MHNIEGINVLLEVMSKKLDDIHGEVKKTNGKVAEIEKWRLERTDFIDDMYSKKSEIILAMDRYKNCIDDEKMVKGKILSKIIDLIGIGIVSAMSFLFVNYIL